MHVSKVSSFYTLVFLLGFTFSVHSQSEIIANWTFHPNYTLPRNAANYPGNKVDAPFGRFERFKRLGGPISYHGQPTTERISSLLSKEELPTEAFSIELFVLNHVNQPVGALLTVLDGAKSDSPAWYLGCFDGEWTFSMQDEQGHSVEANTKMKKGWKKYWLHIVATYTGQEIRLFVNGELKASEPISLERVAYGEKAAVDVFGYFGQEPFMELSNLVKRLRIYSEPWAAEDVRVGFEEMKVLVEKGALFDEIFHFTAGPYLNFATQESINLVWETDRPTQGIVHYGTTLPLDQNLTLDSLSYIHEASLTGLQSATPYYYEVEAIDENGEKMKSGILTFSTAVKKEQAYSFCILGDTESRPHINQQLGKMVWGERPNFIMHLGDVTDGGKQPHKFEWTQEYFTGITPVASRIPVFPVAGNGESDLYWYNRYHALPAPEAYYKFTYGNAEFFMLNTNAREELSNGGKQYEWLKQALAKSTAAWKFVAHHHCPLSSDENDFGNTWAGKKSSRGDARFDDLKKLYEDYGVDVVFYGHVHAYERSWPIKDGQIDENNGVVYVKSGGAGGNLEDFAPTRSWFTNKVQEGHHYCLVDVYGGYFRFKMFDIEGRLKDFFELEKK